jgi:hypothetical protein
LSDVDFKKSNGGFRFDLSIARKGPSATHSISHPRPPNKQTPFGLSLSRYKGMKLMLRKPRTFRARGAAMPRRIRRLAAARKHRLRLPCDQHCAG